MSSVIDSSAVLLFFIANFFYSAAYIVKDILWLRILTICAAFMTFPYFILQNDVMYSAVFWASCFAFINLFHVILLLRARRPVDLPAAHQHVKDMVFRHLTSREASKLLAVAQWHTGQASERLINSGQEPAALYLLKSGNVDIIQEDQVVANRGPGSFLGELSYMTGALPVADVKFNTDSEYLSWEKNALNTFLQKNSDIQKAFEAVLSTNVAGKLASGNKNGLGMALS